ncbi:hypothetical protein HDU87_000651 [Geranomyces variabilis]|uniref:Uncharacterized protein n=1 Tax=Geranomyces variabilis TaxID=109894 RepID=A0AAD5TC47_9FUNG|nr:hypothetical protein HDU87_000651 [Geranomyces variabilis]
MPMSKYHLALCSNIRNERRLKEFLIRAFLTGFQHVYLYDNNMVPLGRDIDHYETVAPFIKAGMVTHLRTAQSRRSNYTSDYMDMLDNMYDCESSYGPTTDWLGVNDADESLVIDFDGSSKFALGKLLDELDAKYAAANSTIDGDGICQVSFIWQFMHAPPYTFEQKESLLESYPEICVEAQPFNAKSVFRPAKVLSNVGNSQHYFACREGSHITLGGGRVNAISNDGPFSYRATLLHYYQRSLQEQVWKKEVSVTPMIRSMSDLFAGGNSNCTLDRVQYNQDYLESFNAALDLPISTYGRVISYPNTRPPGDPDEEVYSLIKQKLAEGAEWDEKGYRELHPGVVLNKAEPGMAHWLRTFHSAREQPGCWTQRFAPS